MFLGLGKTLFNSSACLFEETRRGLEIELVLSERILRQKATGVWPERALRELEPRWSRALDDLKIAENRDVISPLQREKVLDHALPFFDHLKHEKLDRFSRHFNSDLRFVTHHLCHAMAAVTMSPFEKCLIVVVDGAGSAFDDFAAHGESSSSTASMTAAETLTKLGGVRAQSGVHEECSVYLMDQGQVRSVFKRWRKFEPGRNAKKKTFSEGAGIFYESMAEYIFNNGRSAGKVMGLAPFGKKSEITSRLDFLNQLDWERAFNSKGKKSWDESGRFSEFANLAASTQFSFEEDLMQALTAFRGQWPEYDKVIMTGGCALNCTFNAKLLHSKLFSEIYVPPFPGDECIGFGAASFLFSQSGLEWKKRSHEEQHGYFGLKKSLKEEKDLREIFKDLEITKPDSISKYTSRRLANGDIVAWFQGRSESGPRALGHRSILANPALPGLKDRLNSEIKFREDFRPYGCSCLHEVAHEYFEVEKGFNNPYMSFAVRTRFHERARLSQVTHVDGTSRMQTVRKGQNPLFHRLIEEFGKQTGLYCLLNTSLNVMGEPIVETAEDAKAFLLKTPVDGLAIGPLFIQRRL
jgi:carbamoyltransferase